MERQNGHSTEVTSNGGRMVITEVVTLIEGEWLCYRIGQFNTGRMVMLQR